MDTDPKKRQKTSDRAYYMFALRIVGDFGISIAAPAVLASFLGVYLDEKYNKYPLFLILCLFLAMFLTAKMINKKAKKYGKEYQNMVDGQEVKKIK